MLVPSKMLAGSTGLEPAASGVTGRRSNQLNYHPKLTPASQKVKVRKSVSKFEVLVLLHTYF